MIYLASPYSHTNLQIMEDRYKLVAYNAAAMAMVTGDIVYSPIAHWHDAAKLYNLPTTYAFWIHQNHGMIDRASSLCVLKLQGWEHSVGVQGETEYAKSRGLPITYAEPLIP